jgi:small subunit ribosomal protein S2
MAIPSFTIRDLLEAGVHYGHMAQRWNPKMAPYIFGERNKVHIIDLQQTVPLLQRALEAIRDCVAKGGRILFVGTKAQGADLIREAATRCGQYFVNYRWLGGTLTNWKTVHQSIKRMKEMEQTLKDPGRMTKKEILKMNREYEKLQRSLGGISEMGGIPHILFVLDTIKETIAVREAYRLGIPVVAVLDTNSDPDLITYPFPGNDDATRSIKLYCELISSAVLEGLQSGLLSAGIDIGASAELPQEEFLPAPASESSIPSAL